MDSGFTVTVNKHARVGKPGKAPINDANEEKVHIDMRIVAVMKLWDFSKAEIAKFFGISTARMNKVISDNRAKVPWASDVVEALVQMEADAKKQAEADAIVSEEITKMRNLEAAMDAVGPDEGAALLRQHIIEAINHPDAVVVIPTDD